MPGIPPFPYPLPRRLEEGQPSEADDLATLMECGLRVAPAIVVPGSAEEEFYRLNNLITQLELRFAGLELDFPDDELVEDLAPEARELVRSHYLLQEFIDAFFEQVATLPGPVVVRRAGEAEPGSPAAPSPLLAVKNIWASEWTFERLWARLERGGPLVPEFRPLLVHLQGSEPLPRSISDDASALLGHEVLLRGNALGICRVESVGHTE